MPAFHVISLLQELRPIHWSKNLLVFIPAILTLDFINIKPVVLGFFIMNLIASCGYIINDLKDFKTDRLHPSKKLRPFASGKVSPRWMIFLILILSFTAFILLTFLPWKVTLLFLIYASGTLIYTFLIKKLIFLDVLCLTLLMTLRIYIGGSLSQIDISYFLSTFAVYLFLSLSLLKKYSILLRLKKYPEIETIYQRFSKSMIRILGSIMGALSVIVAIAYLFSKESSLNFSQPAYLSIGIISLVSWLKYLWSHDQDIRSLDDPLSFALTNKFSLICLLFASISFLLAKFL